MRKPRRPELSRLGQSQLQVLRYLDLNPNCSFTAQALGDALRGGHSHSSLVRHAWATRILAGLFRKGLIASGWDGKKSCYFSLTGPCAAERGLTLRTPGTARRCPEPRRRPNPQAI